MKLYLNKGVFLVLLLAFCIPQELFSQITPGSLELSDYKGVVDINSPHDAGQTH